MLRRTWRPLALCVVFVGSAAVIASSASMADDATCSRDGGLRDGTIRCVGRGRDFLTTFF